MNDEIARSARDPLTDQPIEAGGESAEPMISEAANSEFITPKMLHFIELSQEQIDVIVRSVPGGASNIIDIHPLSPLQEGMLFHRLLDRTNDTYVLTTLIELQPSVQIDAVVDALQRVIDRHDALRTAVLWEGLPRPVQVVYRKAALRVDALVLDPARDALEQLQERMQPRRHSLDLQRAPLVSLELTPRIPGDKWYALLRVHHVVCDHQSLNLVVSEMVACIEGSADQLPPPASYRSHVAESQTNLGMTEAQEFFRSRLRDVDETTAPFNVVDVHGGDRTIEQATLELPAELIQQIRAQARRQGVSTARLFHAAWALVVAHTSGREDVVFGTVLLAARQRGIQAQRMLGMSVNTLPIRLKLHGVTAGELVTQVNQEVTELLGHEQFPLTLAQRCSSVPGKSPLFTSILNYRRTTVDRDNAPADRAGIRVLGRSEAWTNYPITLIVDDRGDGVSLLIQTDPRIDPRRLAAYVYTAVESLVHALETAPDRAALSLSILPEAEQHQLVALFNATQAEYPQEKLIHELFEQQVECTPHAVAVVCAEQYLTYRQLNARANQLARYLRQRGAGPDRFIGLCVERGIDMIVGLLGILKAGSAYVPLDPNYPSDRVAYMLSDTAPMAVLTQESLKSRLPSDASVVALDTQWNEVEHYCATNIGRDGLRASSTDLAYVIYTSGSTGRPKGVAIEHRNAVNMIWWAQSAVNSEAFADTLQSTSLNFDLSVYECFVPLCSGGCLRVVTNALALLNESAGVTLVNTVPSAMKAILDSATVPSSVRIVNLAGEALKKDLVDRIFAQSAVECVCNLYGPSETTTYSTWVSMPREQGFNASVGRPIANTQIYILDRHRNLLPLGVVGEIYIGGAGVARGYLNRPELTAERFVVDPFSQEPQARLYKTGDLGRWLADGTIEYLGRNDSQVKIRGFRIELGEIEAKLMVHQGVKEAVVLAREDVPGEKRLVAYVVPEDYSNAPGVDALRAHLQISLPEYMVPSAFVMLERLPLTQNGKLDRRALPAPELDAYMSRRYEAPEGDVECVLATIWQSLLRVERVGRHDNFFELGGHSLLIVQLMEQLRRVGFAPEVRRIFESATLGDLARVLTSEVVEQFEAPTNSIVPGADTIRPEMLPLVALEQEHIDTIVRAVPGGSNNIQDIYPLAPMQEGFLFHHLMNEQGGDTYVLPFVFVVSSRQRLIELTAALQFVIDRHDVLRTAVLWEDLPCPVQVVYRRAVVPLDEISLASDRAPAEQIKDWIRPERQRIDLRQAPLVRVQAAVDPNGSQWFVVVQLHHITFDHVTLEMLTAEIVAHLEGRTKHLPISMPYRNHVAQALAYARKHNAEAFFQHKLGAVDEPTAPFGLLDVHGDGTLIDESREELEVGLTERVRMQARRLGVSAATLFHAAWGLVIAHTSGRNDVVFGSLLLGRLQSSAASQPILGVFINTLPLRLQLRDISAKQLVERTQRELIELLSHEQASLAVAQRCSGIAGSAPLFSALLNYRHSVSTIEEQWSGASGVELLGFQERTNYPITMSVDDLGAGFALTAQTDRRVDPRRLSAYLRTAVESLMDALERAPQTAALSLSVVPASERREIFEVFNATESAYSRDQLIHQLVEAQVRRTPNAVAVTHEGRSLTYEVLNSKADQLARVLRQKGIGANKIVGICVERSVEMVVGLLAILKAGGAYLPLDPSYPTERLAHMLQDAAPQVVLTQQKLKATLPHSRSECIVLDAALVAPAEPDDIALDTPELSTTDLLYVIYTSGSTGRPKGTAMTHGAMVNLIEWHRKVFGVDQQVPVLQFAALSFDVAFQETFSTLCGGDTLVLVDEWVRKDARALLRLLSEQSIERIFLPPLMLQTLAESFAATGVGLTNLRDVITAGEQLRISAEIVNLFKSLPGCRLHNHYGPTETHVVTALTLTGAPEDWPALPTIGSPIANMRMYVLDELRQPAPMGVVGELYIGGPNLARGYLHRPELTAERFIPNPFVTDEPSRLYKTGDLGRWRPDGNIEYLGRNDDQVKIRGYRVELGEIERQLALHDMVKEVAVVAREDNPGDRRLVAYVTKRDDRTPSAEDLRAHVRGVLPEHMIPSAYVVLETLPLTPTGKLNRRALPAPDLRAYGSRQYEAPQGDVEEILAGIWQSLLRIERIGRHDNFFELGGHSLLIVQLMERLRRVGLSTALRSVFESASLADMAALLTSAAVEQFELPPNLIANGCESIQPGMLPLVELEQVHVDRIVQSVPGGAANIQDIYPLVPLQEGILFHHLMNESDGDTYVVPIVLSVSSRGRLDELITALQAVVDRHDVLRTAVLWENLPQPIQVVYRRVQLSVTEVAFDPSCELQQQIQEWLTPGWQRLDIRQASLMRLQVAKHPGSDEWYVLLQLHHMAIDHVAVEIITAEAVAHLQGQASRLQKPMPYRNHVAQSLAYARTHDAEEFFRAKLADIDEPTAPFGLLDVYGHGSDVDEAYRELEAPLAQRIRAQARRLSVSSATLFHAAWGLVIAHTTGRDDVVFGSVLLGRLQGSAGAHLILGLFINTLPLRLRLQGLTAKALVETVQRELIELLSHEQASLATAQRCSGIAGSSPLFTALLNYRHSVRNPETEWSSAHGIEMLGIHDRTNYPITLSVDDQGDGFALTTQTNRRIDPRRVTDYLYTAMQSLLDALEHEPQTSALALGIVPADERRQVIELFNNSQAHSQNRLIHQLFEQQVARAPDAAAVSFEEQVLTYAELNDRANQLARHLRDRGVGPDQRVGICVERGLEMVVGLLAILKAGAGYLPLDPNYPAERLQYMLEDAAPVVLLTRSGLKDKLPHTAASIVCLDEDWNVIAKQSTRNLDAQSFGLRPHHLAYVIYTSGSTGKPKGVQVEHRNVVRLFSATDAWFNFNDRDVWTLFHSFAFDFSVWELWGALLYGGRVVVVPYLTARSPEDFYHLVCAQGVTVLNQTPSAFAQLIDAQTRSQEQHSLRAVIFGGEALELHTLRPWVARNPLDRTQLVNMYGITETTVHVTYRLLSRREIESERGSVIGRPIPDLQVYLLNGHMQPVPLGAVGEMYVGGNGVARGYLNRPELTAERFVDNPFTTEPRARMYRTGDLGRWRSDGTLEYLGRNDQQVKIRGFRIELGEIEAQLARHEAVKDAVVVARGNASGEKRLVAYVILQDATAPPQAETLRLHLAQILPEHMVPSAFVMLERFPLTANGKLDRAALPAPDELSISRRQYVEPRSELESKLCEVWAQVLGLARVGIEDNFFAIGGDSILSLRVLARAQAAGVTFGVADLFRNQTIAQLASLVQAGNSVSGRRRKIDAFELLSPDERAQFADAKGIADAYPLSRLQEGMYFHSESSPASAIYHDVASYCIEAAFDKQHFEAAVVGLLQRHPVLRSGFVTSSDHRLLQVVHEHAAADVQVADLSQLSSPQQDLLIREWIAQEKHRGFVWSKPPLLRFFVHVRAQDRFQYSLSFHHAILDGWSAASLQAELLGHYSDLLQSKRRTIEAPRALYRDYIARELQALQSSQSREFWRKQLEGDSLQPLRLADESHGRVKGQDVHTFAINFDPQVCLRLESTARKLGVHMKLLLLAAHVKVMSLVYGERTILTGMVSHGRLEDEDGERVLGLHLNSLPLRVNLHPCSWKELLMQLRDMEAAMLPHRHYPFAAIQELLHDHGLIDTLFNFTRFHVYKNAEDAVKISAVEGFEQTNFSLLLNFSQDLSGADLSLSMGYDPAVFSRTQMERIGGYYQRALQRIAENIDADHDAATLLSQAEEEELLVKFNRAAPSRSSSRLVQELFESQVARTPDAVAVAHADQSLTYAELNRRANQLGRYLRSRGVRPDQLVGICVARGLDMAVGLLGILKAGGAYLPLDPNYPAERLRYMLQDAAPRFVLTQEKLRSVLPAATIALDAEDQEISRAVGEDLPAHELGMTPQSSVYVIYTSGSTGRPKGTAMAHGSMVNLIEWHRQEFPEGEGQRVLQFAALSFDVAFQETFTTLCTGGTLVMLDEWVRRDARALTELLIEQSIQRLFVPPLVLQSLAEHFTVAAVPPRMPLRDVITAGEQLRISPEIVRFFSYLNECRLHNHYGPTETHVVTASTLSGDPTQWPELPTIGQPIAATQIHVLDARHQLLPRGVAGEIYIGGANVARGYRERPELTAQRFLADRFGAGPNARVYKTGDLGRWRADGTLEYLGRNDDQVKIRGYRIELAEIEACLAKHAQVKEAAVVLGRDSAGDKRLLAYFTTRDSSELKLDELRSHLKASLPDYMVPSAFVLLQSLPVTQSGKLDRRALPSPELEAFATAEYESPQGQVEETLAKIWQDALRLPRVGRWDNFFELGGHSLMVLKVLFQINEACATTLSVADVYKSSTVADLAAHIRGAAVEDGFVDLEKEAALDGKLLARPAPAGLRNIPEKAILLTGGTGFVGRFLLAQLLEDTDASIHCLVRAKSDQEAMSRIRTTLSYWDLWRDEFEQRLVAIAGDLRLPCLGINKSRWELLGRNIDSIYHCATSMNHLETYAMAKAANVDASKDLLKLATLHKLKLINFVSTLGIFGASNSNPPRVVREATSIDHELHRQSAGYVASKWVGEKIFMSATALGIPCNIFRLGFIWADARQGRYDELQRGYRIFKSCMLSGYGIKNFRHDLAPTAVDYAARAMLFLSRQNADGGGIFHISAPTQMAAGVFERCNEMAGTSLTLLPLYDWIGVIKRLHHHGQSLPVVPLVQYAFSMDEASFYRHEQAARASAARFDCERTLHELQLGGVVAPVFDDKLLKLCVDSMLARDAELSEQEGHSETYEFGVPHRRRVQGMRRNS